MLRALTGMRNRKLANILWSTQDGFVLPLSDRVGRSIAVHRAIIFLRGPLLDTNLSGRSG